MTQPELFCQERVGNLLREVPMTVGRITFAPDHVPGVRKMVLPDMMGQPPAQPVATSVAAADAIKPCADTLRARVLDYIREQGKTGATDDEIQVALNMNGSTQRPRRVELFQAGKICMAPMMRKTRAGRNANVWVAI
jgi:hypothetical protein